MIDLSLVADFDEVTSVGLRIQGPSFDWELEERTLPNIWCSSGAPPATENNSPEVLYNSGSNRYRT